MSGPQRPEGTELPAEGPEGRRSPRRPRGVRLTDLDRRHRYVIAHDGTRWETVGVLADDGSVRPVAGPGPGRRDGVPSTGQDSPAG